MISEPPSIDVDVLVIGAGVSGLAAARHLQAEGLSLVVLEQRQEIGGLWAFDARRRGGAMAFTRINVSKHNYAFSDFPFPPGAVDFPRHDEVLEYIQRFADHHGLKPKIRYGIRVVRIVRREDGGWTVEAAPSGTEAVVHYRARFVAIATGHHGQPLAPAFAGMDDFRGVVMHSADYKDHRTNGLSGKNVVVVGVGNSGVDVSSNAAEVASHVALSARSGAWIAPNYLFGVPLDLYVSRFNLLLPWRWLSFVYETAISVALGHPRRWGLNPKFRAMQSHPTVSSTLIKAIQDGRAVLRPNISRIVERGVVFEDGSSAPADVIVFCTGYLAQAPPIEPAVAPPAIGPDGAPHLYLNMFHPHLGHNLAFIGLVQPASGGLLPIADVQARLFASVCAGRTLLPGPKAMGRKIDRDLKAIRRRYAPSPRHALQRDPLRYNDELCRLMRLKPAALDDFRLWWRLAFGSAGVDQWTPRTSAESTARARASVASVPVPLLNKTVMALVAFALLAPTLLILSMLGSLPR